MKNEKEKSKVDTWAFRVLTAGATAGADTDFGDSVSVG